MSQKKDGGRAFPCVHERYIQYGMTLRDYFAGQALAGILSRSGAVRYDESETAAVAFTFADAMIAEREK